MHHYTSKKPGDTRCGVAAAGGRRIAAVLCRTLESVLFCSVLFRSVLTCEDVKAL